MILRRIFVLPIKFYQKYISPAIGGHCIYTPTCSEYAKQAILKHGIIKGLILGITRLFRCSKFYFGGTDPVPEKFSFKYIKDQYIIFHR